METLRKKILFYFYFYFYFYIELQKDVYEDLAEKIWLKRKPSTDRTASRVHRKFFLDGFWKIGWKVNGLIV